MLTGPAKPATGNAATAARRAFATILDIDIKFSMETVFLRSKVQGQTKPREEGFG
jgi:hypothetical protein